VDRSLVIGGLVDQLSVNRKIGRKLRVYCSWLKVGAITKASHTVSCSTYFSISHGLALD